MSQEQANGEEDSAPARALFEQSSVDRDEMAENYLPESEDWDAKTVLDLGDPAAVSALRQLGVMFPEVDDLQPLVDSFLADYTKSKTSVGGASRDEYKSILVSMYGGNIDEETARGAFVDAMAGDLDDD